MLFSSDLQPYTGDLSPAASECIKEISTYFGGIALTVLTFDKHSLVIPVTFKVNLPIRGAVNIDIRPIEPMLIKIFRAHYPYMMPTVMSDRKDFPRKHLSHLYAGSEDEPAKLCLVRNNRQEWFANKTISGLLDVTAEWLFKAGGGILSGDGGEWDPLRPENYIGSHAYSYALARDIVSEKRGFLPGDSFALLFGYTQEDQQGEDIDLPYRSIADIPFIAHKEIIQPLKENSDELRRTLGIIPVISILIWQPDDIIDEEYCTILPDNYGALKAYLRARGIDINHILRVYINAKCKFIKGIPVMYAIKRPAKLVGYDGQYEFINFLICASGFRTDHMPAVATVKNQIHLEPFSKALAQKLSGESRNMTTLYIGAGALGSKMALHDARGGNDKISTCDPDTILQHNMARHALFADKIGRNKAEALTEAIKAIYGNENAASTRAFAERIHFIPAGTIRRYDCLVDTTAGMDTLNFLSSEDIGNTILVTRGEIADEGRLGLFYGEGAARNPRIDDLVNLAYYKAIENPDLARWLQREALKQPVTLDIGLGCSSTTTVMPDDVISFHASVFSKVLYELTFNRPEAGLLYISTIENQGFPVINSHHIRVEPFRTFQCNNQIGWEIRMMTGIPEKLLQLCRQKKPVETGGVLIGMASYKTKTIHVFDIIVEPRGSSGHCMGFTRGNTGLPQEIDVIKEMTGNMIGYIGEWHSHPMDLESLSDLDLSTIDDLITINNQTPIPTCAVIVTTDKILPFVFA